LAIDPSTSLQMPAAAFVVQLITWPVVAALVIRAARGRASRVAWIVVVLVSAYGVSTLLESGSMVSNALIAVANSSLIALFGLYPDGHPTPRWIVVPVAAGVALQGIDVLSSFSLEQAPWWPWHILTIWVVTLVGGQLYRYRRRSSVDERERTRWPVLAMLAVVLSFTLTSIVNPGLGLGAERLGSLAVLLLALPGLGFALGLLAPSGINVDIALRWCVLIGGASVSLAAGILAMLGALRALGVESESRTWATAILAAAVAIPVAAAWRRIADGVVFGRRTRPLQALAELGSQLGKVADPRDVPATIVSAVTDSLSVGGARLLIDGALVARTGDASHEESFPIVHAGHTMGTLAVSPRPGDTRLSALDRTVVERMCERAAAALHGAHLLGELADARARVVIAREDERRRLRRDLHDDLAPMLAALGIKAALVERFSRDADERAAEAASELAGHLEASSRQVRAIAYNLRPPILDDRGLVAAVQESVVTGGAPVVHLEAPNEPLELPAAVEACALRIIQEAVLNVRRHAGASRCDVTISKEPDALCLEIVDDGVGFADSQPRGVGIRSMMERAAEIGGRATISSRPGLGTRVSVRLALGR
jgi:signal transduction histidine kinase